MSLQQINAYPNIDNKTIELNPRNKVEIAISRLKLHIFTEAKLAFSGGKDSVVIERLARMADIPFKAHYSLTGLDAPELVYFIRDNYPEIEVIRPEIPFFKALATKNGFPTRTTRWCCELLKERVRGGIIIMGVRWQESPGKRGKRRLFEACHKDELTHFLNPIIDWTDKDVWEFIHKEHIPYCSLYDEKGLNGKPLFKRLGCVLCPMGTPQQAQIQINRFPKLAEAWHRAFCRFYDLGWDSVKRWNNAEEMWQWWLSRKGQGKTEDCLQGRFI